MLDFIYTKLTDPQFLLSILVAIATMATILTVAMPLIETDTLAQRMKAVATERERIRARERERLVADKGKTQSPPGAESLYEANRRTFQFVEMARYRSGENADGDGWLSRSPGGSRVFVFPAGDASLVPFCFRSSIFSSSTISGSVSR